MGVHSSAANASARLIKKHGRPITVVKSSLVSRDPFMPWRGTVDPYTDASVANSVPTYGAFVEPISLSELGYLEAIPVGDIHKRGNKICLIAAKGLPDLTEYEGILDGTSIWKIVNIHTLEPGTEKILYFFEVAQ